MVTMQQREAQLAARRQIEVAGDGYVDTPGNEAGDLARFTALLPDGTYGLCCEPAVNDFRGERVPLGDVEAVVDSLPGCSTWLSIAQVDPSLSSGRGTKKDMRRLVALPNDFDVKPGGFRDFESVAAAIADLSATIGSWPAVIVHTGHGVQAWWLLDPDDPDWACDGPDDPRWLEIVVVVERRWKRHVVAVCARYDAGMDNVFDVTRVMRLPGTVNTKDPEAHVPVTVVAWRDDWIPLSFTALTEALDDAGVPELDGDRDTPGDVISPAGDWPWAESTCRYGEALITGFATDTPGDSGRHPWLLGRATRLAALHRYGCLTEADHARAVDVLRARFAQLIADPAYGTPRPPHRGEFAEALGDMVRKVEGWSESKLREEFTNGNGDVHDHGMDWVDDEGAALRARDDSAEPATRALPLIEPDVEDAVFGASPELGYIRALARERMVSPWALLTAFISIVIAATDPALRIPPFIGDRASLNFGAVLASPSGGGKSSTMSIAVEEFADAIDEYRVHQLNPSSGEGIIALFVDTDARGNQETKRTKVVSIVDEIATLATQGARSGSTLMSIMRSAISGQLLSTHGAEKSRRRTLPAHAYRYCLLVGVQRSTAMLFLDDHDAGTPQRFVWMPADDPRADPDAPLAGGSPFTGWKLGVHGDTVGYPEGVREQVREAHADRQRGHGDALDGHAMLTRLKVAAGLALLHRSTAVSDELWAVAGDVMGVSDRTRSGLLTHARREMDRSAAVRGRRRAIEDEAAGTARVRRAALVLARYVHKAGGSVTRKQLRSAAGRHKDVFQDALETALTMGLLGEEDVEHHGQAGSRYLPGPVKP